MKKILIIIVIFVLMLYVFNNKKIIYKVSRYFEPNIEYKNYKVKIPENLYLYIKGNNKFTQYLFGFIPDNIITRYLLDDFIKDDTKMYRYKNITSSEIKFVLDDLNPKGYLLFDDEENEYEIIFFKEDSIKKSFLKQYESLINSEKEILYLDNGQLIILNKDMAIESYSILLTKSENNQLKNIIYYFKMDEYIISIQIYVNNDSLERKNIMKKLFNAVHKASQIEKQYTTPRKANNF